MLPNLDVSLYGRFKKEGYRIKKLSETPVLTVPELVRLGYLDVNRTIRGITSDQSRSFKQVVASFIETLLASPPASQAEFDQRHHVCCQRCLEVSSPTGAHIHYGQAQKLLNMSLKYLYNEYAAYKGTENRFGFPDSNVEHFFHLPIDSQIRNYLINMCSFADPTSLPWSQWAYEDYISFQRQLRARLGAQYRPLEVDYMLWNTNGASVENAILRS